MFALVFRFAAVALALAACVSHPATPERASKPAERPTPAGSSAPGSGKKPPGEAATLTERAPDTCRLSDLATLKGQPAGNLRTVRLAGPSRIIPPGGIVDQMDYIPQRINAYIDDNGIITRLECG